jgi:simple sugar transport system ATP-binding protein
VSATAPTPVSDGRISARGLVKRYGTITAVDDVDLDVGTGEIVAIVGDNGAGKSTLIKMLSGAVHPDEGNVLVDGAVVRLRSPLDARAVGIETIYQDLALLPNLDVATNLYLGREEMAGGLLGRLGVLSRRRMRQEAHEHLQELRITLPRTWGTPVAALSGGQRQSVAIARAMVWASRLVIMDEPTAALGVAQSQAVLELVRRVRDRGTSVVIISHILPHVLELADRIVVMRHGAKVADLPAADVTQDRLIELIVGFTRGSDRGVS